MNHLHRLFFILFFVCSLSASNEKAHPTISEDCINTYAFAPEDIFDLQASPYIDLVTGNDYTAAIELAINHASNLVTDPNPSGSGTGGVILFPGNTTIEISNPITMRSNITFRASHSKATIQISKTYTLANGDPITVSTPMFVISNRQKMAFENIIFDGDNKVSGLVNFGTSTVDEVSIINCEFQNMITSIQSASGVALGNATNVLIKGCTFRNSNFGILIVKRNRIIKIEDNTFESTLSKNPIRIQGTRTLADQVTPAFSSDIWITGNKIDIGRAESIIETLNMPRDPETGAVDIGPYTNNSDYIDWRKKRFGPSAIYLSCGENLNEENIEVPTDNHLNVFIENNSVNGPDYGFFDGGSADLYSIKDVINLHLNNNVSRNSGDLGMSIERSSNAVVSSNTVERNNSSGIAFTDVKNSVITNNVVANNALRRDLIYKNVPYGGILLLGATTNALIEGNQLYCYSSPGDISFVITITEGVDYTETRTSPTSYYGIMIRKEGTEDTAGSSSIGTPSGTKIGINQYSGHRWGPIFNEGNSTQITENLTATAYPTDEDLPEGTWIRNSNLIFSALGWGVIDRNQGVLVGDVLPGDSIILDDVTGIQVQDIIGIELPDFNVHWTTVSAIGVSDNKIELTDDPTETLVDGARVVALRWKTVTQ